MPLTTTQEMLAKAQRGQYAVGAFNVENMEMVQAVLDAAQELRAPVILQTTPSTVSYGRLEAYCANAAAMAAKTAIPAALHLDHGNSFALAMQALRVGYTSIMIDGSRLDFEENVRLSGAVQAACRPSGIPVEAELGTVGGKEDDMEGEGGQYTDPQQAQQFASRTGVDSLAVGIGTAHGVYAKTPKLDVERLSEIRQAVAIPLVLHGASGLPDAAVQECVRRGICKVNFATELRAAYSTAVKAVLAERPETIDPKAYGTKGREAVKELVMEKIMMLGSQGKA